MCTCSACTMACRGIWVHTQDRRKQCTPKKHAWLRAEGELSWICSLACCSPPPFPHLLAALPLSSLATASRTCSLSACASRGWRRSCDRAERGWGGGQASPLRWKKVPSSKAVAKARGGCGAYASCMRSAAIYSQKAAEPTASTATATHPLPQTLPPTGPPAMGRPSPAPAPTHAALTHLSGACTRCLGAPVAV